MSNNTIVTIEDSIKEISNTICHYRGWLFPKWLDRESVFQVDDLFQLIWVDLAQLVCRSLHLGILQSYKCFHQLGRYREPLLKNPWSILAKLSIMTHSIMTLYIIYILIFIVISILAVIVFKGLSLKKFSKVTLCLSKNRQSLLHKILYNDTFSSDTYNLEISR